MASNFKGFGEAIDHVAAADIVSGEAVVIGDRIGIAATDIASGATGALKVKGVFELAKLSTDVIAQGDAVYWNDTSKEITLTSAGNTPAGYAAAAAGDGAVLVDVNING